MNILATGNARFALLNLLRGEHKVLIEVSSVLTAHAVTFNRWGNKLVHDCFRKDQPWSAKASSRLR